jgi:hypothetical protein
MTVPHSGWSGGSYKCPFIQRFPVFKSFLSGLKKLKSSFSNNNKKQQQIFLEHVLWQIRS